MIVIKDKTSCCGCSACMQRCPKSCITMSEDNEGFLYPSINMEKCIDCGMCEKVCPFITPEIERQPHDVIAMINKDDEIRCESSSGGIFTLIAEPIIRSGGVVFGAKFDKDWQVVIDYTESLEGLQAFRGSKYVQAQIKSAFCLCEDFLKSGRKVLFTGSPCQIAGLRHYLRKEYDNLLTCDFVCHGVPSPKVWRLYIDEVVAAGTKALCDLKFRNKSNGWKRFNFALNYDVKGKQMTMSSNHHDNHYMRAFLSDMVLRPSCHNCRAKEGRSGSDITIGDFWGIQNHYPEMDDDKGTSLVLINTEKGFTAIDCSKTKSLRTSYNVAPLYNAGLHPSVKPHPKREMFFNMLDNSVSVVSLIETLTKPSLKYRVRAYGKSLLKKNIKLIFGRGMVGKYRINTTDIVPDSINMLSFDKVSEVTFRDKQSGWRSYNMKIKFE